MQLEINFWTGCLLIGVFLVLLVVCTYGALILLKGADRLRGSHNKREVVVADQPISVRKEPKRFSYEFWHERHTNTTNRLDDHEQRISAVEQVTISQAEITRRLQKTEQDIDAIQKSRAEALEKINNRFERVMVGLHSIAVKVGAEIK